MKSITASTSDMQNRISHQEMIVKDLAQLVVAVVREFVKEAMG
jgi:hypothetical protein